MEQLGRAVVDGSITGGRPVPYAELGRLGYAFFGSGPARTVSNLAEVLSCASDRLAIDDRLKVAEALIGPWQGVGNYRLALRVDVDGFRDTVAERVDYGIGVFMRAFARASA